MVNLLLVCVWVAAAVTTRVDDPFCGVLLADLSKSQPASTREMTALLQDVLRKTKPMESAFRTRAHVQYLEEQMKRAGDSSLDLRLAIGLGVSYLNSGQTTNGLILLNRINESIKKGEIPLPPKEHRLIKKLVGVACLRVAEEENCLTNHTTASCLAPIQAAGIHKNQRGSRAAIDVFTEMLRQNSRDLEAKWLLNIAAMTLGEWPSKVPKAFLIPEQAFASDFSLPAFPDIAGKLGLDANDLAGGVVADDFDNDGNTDLLVTSWAMEADPKYYHNAGDGTFHERGEAAGLHGLSGALNLIQADYNNDGFVDVLMLRGGWLGSAGKYPLSLLRNNQNGTFTEVTREAGLLRYRGSQTAAWLDFNNDGHLDIFVGNETWGQDAEPCELYRNNGNGTFTEIAQPCGVAAVGVVKGVAAGDFNNDGRPDLYLSLREGKNILFRNDGPQTNNPSAWTFANVAEEAGVSEPFYSFPTWFFDYNNDGWLDLFVAGYRIFDVGDVAADYLGEKGRGVRSKLYLNTRDGKFKDVSAEARLDKVLLAMGSNFGDLDNDGWLDLYLGTGDPDLSTLIPNRMFRNAQGKLFQDVTTAGGFGHLQKGHAITFADLDNDGDQDIYAVMGGAYEGDGYRRVLFENPGNRHNWIKLKLEGVQSNRSAIGARLKITVTENGAQRHIYKIVNSGGSFGANPLRQEIGLGLASTVDQLEIFWPTTGKTEKFENVPANKTWYILEGRSALQEIHLKQLAWKETHPMRH